VNGEAGGGRVGAVVRVLIAGAEGQHARGQRRQRIHLAIAPINRDHVLVEGTGIGEGTGERDRGDQGRVRGDDEVDWVVPTAAVVRPGNEAGIVRVALIDRAVAEG